MTLVKKYQRSNVDLTPNFLVSACVGGAATLDDTRAMLTQVGFENIKITPKDDSRKIISQWTPGENKNAGDYVVSAYIEAIKPI